MHANSSILPFGNIIEWLKSRLPVSKAESTNILETADGLLIDQSVS